MSYEIMRQQLLNVFNQNNFLQAWNNRQINTLQYQVPNNYNLNLTINYPGMKTRIENNVVVSYDYRVDLNGIAISHANIIVDLYNKASQLRDEAYILENLLLDIAVNGNGFNRNAYVNLNQLQFTLPGPNLINYVATTHRNLRKSYQVAGNQQWNYNLDELTNLICWIVLQEDINYPMPRYQGRRMPFYRYLETLYCARNPQDQQHTLANVIERALSHSRPALWQGCNINYNPITNLR